MRVDAMLGLNSIFFVRTPSEKSPNGLGLFAFLQRTMISQIKTNHIHFSNTILSILKDCKYISADVSMSPRMTFYHIASINYWWESHFSIEHSALLTQSLDVNVFFSILGVGWGWDLRKSWILLGENKLRWHALSPKGGVETKINNACVGYSLTTTKTYLNQIS